MSNQLKVTKPKRPVPNTRYNWATPQDYEEAMRIYEQAMAIWMVFGDNAQPPAQSERRDSDE